MKKIITILLASAMLLSTVACSSTEDKSKPDSSSQSSSSSEESSKEETSKEETSKDDKNDSNLPDPETAAPIVVYLNDFDAVIGDLFYEATGYKVEVFVGNGAEIASRIESEGDNPLWDVVWMDSMPTMYTMGENGQLLTDFVPENAANLTEEFSDLVPDDCRYYPTGSHSAGLIVYNSDVYTEETAPKTFDDLLDETKGYKIGMANPGVAAPAYPLAAWFFEEYSTDGSLQGGMDYFGEILDEGGNVYPKNPQIVTALTNGEIDVAILQESNAYAMVNAGESITMVWPEDGSPASVRVAGISSKTNNEEIAKLFINFLLEAETQQALVESGDEAFFTPSVTGAEMKEQRAEDDVNLVVADTEFAATNEADIKAWFADMA